MGGEGINSALMDGADIAWKLALVLRGAAKPSLLETYAIERELADHHALEVTNEIHNTIMNLVAMCAEGGGRASGSRAGPGARGLRKRSMLDVSYTGSPLIDPESGETEPGRDTLCGLERSQRAAPIISSVRRRAAARRFPGALGRSRVGRRWPTDGASSRPGGLPEGGVVLLRPDGFIGFRRASADDAAMKALDTHLSTYLHPNFAAADEGEAHAR